MKVLVSGGTGLVGRYVVEELLAAGYAVVVAGRQAPPPGHFSRPVGFRPLSLDPQADHAAAFDDVYHFVHAAFDHLPGKYRGGEGSDPDGFRRRNLDGTVALFEAAKKAGLRRCIFLSSRAVYDGCREPAPFREDMVLSPESLYGEVKLTAERALSGLSAPGFSGTSLRLTGVYGDLRPNKWDGLFADYRAGRPVVARAGTEVHGRDVGRAVALVLQADAAKVAAQSFNVSDIVVDRRDLISLYGALVGCPHPLPEVADHAGIGEMATDRIRALGWRPGGRTLFEATIGSLAGQDAG